MVYGIECASQTHLTFHEKSIIVSPMIAVQIKIVPRLGTGNILA